MNLSFVASNAVRKLAALLKPDFYEVYDAFTRFSKVMRLHDEIQQLRAENGPPGRRSLQPIADAAMADILKSIRSQGLDDTKKAVARQVLTGGRRFLSKHICELVKCFAFDESRLEMAKLAFDSVIDPENYFVVNQAFAFPSTKENLTRFIESRRTERNRPKGH